MAFDTVGGPPAGLVPMSIRWSAVLSDEHEDEFLCPDTEVTCSSTSQLINLGINYSIQNSRGGPLLCMSTVSTGFIKLQGMTGDVGAGGTTKFLVGFVGINGSMDIFIGN